MNKNIKGSTNTDNPFIFGTQETCLFFDITRETLSDWAKRGAPKEKRGLWDLKKLIEWKYGTGDKQELSLESRKLHADVRYREKRAAKEEISLAVLKGEYIAKAEVERSWAIIGTQMKANILMWVRTLTPLLANQDMRTVQKVMTDATYELLDQVSSTGKYTARRVSKST